MNETAPKRLLMLADPPSLETGFARVTQNLMPYFESYFDEIHIWGIGYNGFPNDFQRNPKLKLYPAASYDDKIWHHASNMNRMVNLLANTVYPLTHCWMMHDLFCLNPLWQTVKDVQEKMGIKCYVYFPADSDIDPSWTHIVGAAAFPVSYTEVAIPEVVEAHEFQMKLEQRPRAEITKATKALEQKMTAIPHGNNALQYHPLEVGQRLAHRKKWYGENVRPDDFLMGVVNMHQKRKGMFHSLQILRELIDMNPPWRPVLYFHCSSQNGMDGTDLVSQAQSLKIPKENIVFGDNNFAHGMARCSQHELNEIYNTFDLLLTTTYGEGWGLTVSEAMSAGVCVAAPRHTALRELVDDDRAVVLPSPHRIVLPADNNRLRPVVDAKLAAEAIFPYISDDEGRQAKADAGREFITQDRFNWGTIAEQWMQLFDQPLNSKPNSKPNGKRKRNSKTPKRKGA